MKKQYFAIFICVVVVIATIFFIHNKKTNSGVSITIDNVLQLYTNSKENILNSSSIKTTTDVTTTNSTSIDTYDEFTNIVYQQKEKGNSMEADAVKTFNGVDGSSYTLNSYFDNDIIYTSRDDTSAKTRATVAFDEFSKSYNLLQLPDLNQENINSSTLEKIDDNYIYSITMKSDSMLDVYNNQMSKIESLVGYSSDLLNPVFSDYIYVITFNESGDILEVNSSYSIDISFEQVADLESANDDGYLVENQYVHRTINTKTSIDDLNSVSINKPSNLDEYNDIENINN